MYTKASHKRRSQQAEKAKTQTLQYVNLTTGYHRSDSPKSEANPDWIDYFQDWLTEGGIVTHPCGGKSLVQSLPEEHRAVVKPRGDTLVCTVVDPNGNQVVSFLVNGGDAESQLVWNHLHEFQNLPILKKFPGKAPEGRWCGVVLHQVSPAIENFCWLADFQRTLAWAWLTWSDGNKEAFRQCLDNPSSYSGLEGFECDCCSVCRGGL